MNLDTGMGHDSPRRAKSRTPFLLKIGGVCAGIAAAGLMVGYVIGQPETRPTAPAPTVAPVTTTPEPAEPAEPAGDDGHDHADSEGAPPEVWRTVGDFLDGWTSTDGRTRARIFNDTATDHLADGLAETLPENVIRQPMTRLEVIGSSQYSAEFEVSFADVSRPVTILMAADPEAPSGWLITGIEQH